MNDIDIQISKQYKDIIQKYTSGLFKNSILSFYGIKSAKIKELINGELPNVEVSDSSTDFIFLLEDGTYLHIEFQTTYRIEDLTRFARYDSFLYDRDKRKIQTVIIYSSDVRTVANTLEIGSLIYAPINIMMYDYDGNEIYKDLDTKLKAKQDLTDTDILNLILLPLMKHNIPRYELTKKSVELAKTIEDKTKRELCISSAIAFSSKYLSDNELKRIWEVFRMTDVIGKLIKDELVEVAIKLLKRGIAINAISEDTGLDIETIETLQEELETEEVNNAE